MLLTHYARRAYRVAMHLKEWRDAEHLTMAQAALRLTVSQPAVSRIESGEYMPSPTTIEKLVERSGGQISAADLYAEHMARRAERSAKAA
jgi:transcriptional regulator with XRE-family HTH domain